MKPQTIRRIIEITERTAREGGFNYYKANQIMEKLLPPDMKRTKHAEYLHATSSRKRFRAYLTTQKEPTPEGLEAMLQLAVSRVAGFRRAMRQYVSLLPKGPIGRPRGVESETANELCSEVYATIGTGRSQALALREVLQRYNNLHADKPIHPRTMYRLWKKWQTKRALLLLCPKQHEWRKKR